MAEASDDRLRLLIERIERLEEERKGITDDIKDVYAEGKAVGYDAKMMREIVRLRKMRPDDRREMEAILDLYKSALGLDSGVARRAPEPTPLEQAIARATDEELAARGLVRIEADADGEDDPDDLFERAVRIVEESGKTSTSYLQRQLSIGYNSATRLIERMERAGIVSAPDHIGRRTILTAREPV